MGQLAQGFHARGKQRIVPLPCRNRYGQTFAGAENRLQYSELLTGKISESVHEEMLAPGIVAV